ncbi:DUF4382 domain-containing protein [Sphaerotilaceae bacterium SBD11-9]
MNPWTRLFSLATTAALLFTLGACGGGGGGSDVASPGNNAALGTGTLRLALTDAPACGYDHVYVSIERVRVHQSPTAVDGDGGWSEVVLNPTRRVDLLSLTNGVLDELGETLLPAGHYTQMRLVLAANGNTPPYANAVQLTGAAGEVALKTPSAQQSGLKMNVDIDVAANQLADLVLDFDACKSIVRAGNSGKYLLKPVISVIPRFVSGVLGYVDPTVPDAVVSLQQGGAIVKATLPDLSGRFLLQPVAPGSYTLVVTAAGRTTTAITGVPVVADTVLSLNDATRALPVPVSASGVGTATGTVSITPAPASIEASVRAVQVLSAGPTIEVASSFADETTGLYTMSLPVAAPLVAPFLAVTPHAYGFTADTAEAGRYTLQAASGGVLKSAGPVTLTGGSTVATPFSFP